MRFSQSIHTIDFNYFTRGNIILKLSTLEFYNKCNRKIENDEHRLISSEGISKLEYKSTKVNCGHSINMGYTDQQKHLNINMN